MWGICFLAITVCQLSAVTGVSPPFLPLPPLQTNNTSCAATSCSLDSACRIVFNPRTSSVSPRCINLRDLPQDNRQCSIAGGPLLTEITWGHGGLTKSTFLTLRCKRLCPAGLVCANGVCCAAEPTSPQCPSSLPGNPVACSLECSSDAGCSPGKLCCPTSCGGSVCYPQDPVPPPSCAGVNCSEGLVCVEVSGGINCVIPGLKPGLCPATGVCTPLPPNSGCMDGCQSDPDCPGKEKCCTACSQCKSCIDPFIPSCSNLICPIETPFCIEETAGPSCVAQSAIPAPSTPKSGQCPASISADLSACDEACARDSECPGTEKCCATGCGGAVCNPREIIATCADLVCPSYLQCFDEGPEGARCIPLVQPLDPKPGKCPMSGGVCGSACATDNDCLLDQKCCSDVCGGTSCTAPELEIICANVDCVSGKICVETPTGPTCVGPDAKPGTCPVFSCPVPPPPYPLPSVCQSGCFNDFDCTKDDKCCVECSGCRQCFPTVRVLPPSPRETLCGKPCPPGHRCTDTGLRCIRAPCPGVYKCLPVEPCSLPPETGPCRAAFTRYYYDASGPRPGCRTFTYGGCEGNSNNFRTLRECLRACVGRRYDK